MIELYSCFVNSAPFGLKFYIACQFLFKQWSTYPDFYAIENMNHLLLNAFAYPTPTTQALQVLHESNQFVSLMIPFAFFIHKHLYYCSWFEKKRACHSPFKAHFCFLFSPIYGKFQDFGQQPTEQTHSSPHRTQQRHMIFLFPLLISTSEWQQQ